MSCISSSLVVRVRRLLSFANNVYVCAMAKQNNYKISQCSALAVRYSFFLSFLVALYFVRQFLVMSFAAADSSAFTFFYIVIGLNSWLLTLRHISSSTHSSDVSSSSRLCVVHAFVSLWHFFRSIRKFAHSYLMKIVKISRTWRRRKGQEINLVYLQSELSCPFR